MDASRRYAPFSMTKRRCAVLSMTKREMRSVQHSSASARHRGTIGSIRILFKVCIYLILIVGTQPNELTTHLLFDKHHLS